MRLVTVVAPVIERGALVLREVTHLTWLADDELPALAAAPLRVSVPHEDDDGGNVNVASLAGVRVTCARGRTIVDASRAHGFGEFSRADVLRATLQAARANAARRGGGIVELRE